MMKRYRVLKPHEWQDRPGGGTIFGKPGEMAVISDEVFEAAPPGTFDLLPGEDGFVPPVAPTFVPSLAKAAFGPAGELAGVTVVDHEPASPPQQRKPKAEAFKPLVRTGKGIAAMAAKANPKKR